MWCIQVGPRGTQTWLLIELGEDFLLDTWFQNSLSAKPFPEPVAHSRAKQEMECSVYIKWSVLHCKVANLNTGAGKLFINIIPWIPGQWLPLMISEETDFPRLEKELAMLDFMGNYPPTVYNLGIFKGSLYLNFN